MRPANTLGEYHYAGGSLTSSRTSTPRRVLPTHRSSTSRPKTPSGLMSVDVALQWNNGFTESVHTFANTINTTGGGTHEEGFRAALTQLVNKFAREWGVLKDKDANLTGDDVREGLTAIVSVQTWPIRSSRARPKPNSATPRPRPSCRRSSTISSVPGSSRTRLRARRSRARRSTRRRSDRPPARRAIWLATAKVCWAALVCRAS